MDSNANFGLKIDGALIPAPSGYRFIEADLFENSFRNGAGRASWDLVRQNVANINLTWNNLDGERLQAVIAAIRGKKQFALTALNPLTGQLETRTYYAGERSAELARYVSSMQYWTSLTIPFVEV
jgi:hypothetical protein